MRLGRGIASAAMAAFFCSPAAWAETIGPAELPPPGFVGRQYVDSMGCVFLLEGAGGEAKWVARVTRDGLPLCGYPPSPKVVEIAEPPVQAVPPAALPEQELTLPAAPPVLAEPAPVEVAKPAPVKTAEPVIEAPRPAKPAKKKTPVRKDPLAGKYVQVGAFGIAQNAERAKARLHALGLPVSTQQVSGLTIVFAGPLAPVELQEALRAVRRAGFSDAYLR
ncbi:SPOR domain-containing protein [Sedimentimonas flavescens]|uniref:SPOR domain-containing protein n=1 Tax=Sedimentimonas flavescens TaxID=2851012 RepID=UPI001C49CBE9|nr:SPOR domain-containing protein [Sedimentimonas flavescens]MBW0156748.1 SPOR domain-containing protein [Sedimentimonas flavescens]